MGTPTTNYGYDKPLDGGDDANWGDDFTSGDPAVDPSPGLSGNWEKLDQLFKILDDRVTANELAAQISIGGLYLTTTAGDPASVLGYGSWFEYASGRALVGVGDNGESTWGDADARGSEVHTLVADELATHGHSVDPPATATDDQGAHSHLPGSGSPVGQFLAGGQGAGPGDGYVQDVNGSYKFINAVNVSVEGEHAHTVDIASFGSGATGSGTPHANVQPSLSIFVWLRTA